MALYRHGDLLVEQVDALPNEARRLHHLVLAEGETRDTKLVFRPATKPNDAPPPPAAIVAEQKPPASDESDPGRTQRVLGYTALGVGGAGIVAGAVFGILGIQQSSDLDAACPNRSCAPDQYDELGRKVFGAFVSVEPGETRTLTFRYRLPYGVVSAVQSGTYHLDVEKQAGTDAIGLTVDIDVGKKVETAAPAEARPQWGDAAYRVSTDIREDRAFDVGF